MGKRLPRISVVRAYELGEQDCGYRVLVDRLWPRGLSKETLHLDEWAKDLAPSAELRHWFDHRPERWDEFRQRYALELRARREELERLLGIAARRRIALVFGARDVAHNNAVALKEFFEMRRSKQGSSQTAAQGGP